MLVSLKILIFLAVACWKREQYIIRNHDNMVLLQSFARICETPRRHFTKLPRELITVEQLHATLVVFNKFCPHGITPKRRCRRCRRPGAQP